MTDIPLKVEIEKRDNVAIITLAANFYTSNTMAQNLKASINNLIAENIAYIIVNMKEVLSIDSEGLGTMSFGHKQCISKGGKFVICELNNRDVHEVFEIVNLDKIIPTYKTVDDALNNIKD
ncbi:MAG: STAS domain-containing protein [Vampirovibrionia bacterium]